MEKFLRQTYVTAIYIGFRRLWISMIYMSALDVYLVNDTRCDTEYYCRNQVDSYRLHSTPLLHKLTENT